MRAPPFPSPMRTLITPLRSIDLRSGAWGTLAVLTVAANLRGPMTSVPPLIPRLEAELGLSGVTAGLITMLPVLCMGLLAPLGQRLGHRVGNDRAITLAMALLLAGSLLRAGEGGLWPLYLGTLLVGAGIAISGALLPAVVKERFAARAGMMTGAYMGGMSASAAVGALVAVPIALWLDSWRLSIAVWALPALLGLLVWESARPRTDARPAPTPHARLPWTHPTAWVVMGYLVLQSTQFYTNAAWIPATYEARGWSASDAGVLLTIFAATQGLTGAGMPAMADRLRDNRLLLALSALFAGVGIGGVALAPDALPYVRMALIGFGLGGGFGMGLVYLVHYAQDGAASARLTAMVFLFSYSLASLGPVWFGALRDATGGFDVPWLVLLVLGVIQGGYVLLMSPTRARVP